MRSLSWTLLALLAISWTCVESRSIDASSTSSTTAPIAEQQAAAVAAEIVEEAAVEAVAEVLEETAEKQLKTAIEKVLISNVATQIQNEMVKELETAVKSNDSPVSLLEFEAGSGDNDNELSGTRDKRTIGQISRFATCLFTIIVNPQCFQQMRSSGGGGGAGGGLFASLLGGGSSATSSRRTSSKQEAYNRQLRQWMQYQKQLVARLNSTEGGNYTTPFPILPPTPPEDDEPVTPRPNILQQIIRFKLNLIPNLFRTIQSFLPLLQNLRLPSFGGGGGGGGGLLASLGGLFGGNRGGSSGSFGGSSGSFGGSSGSFGSSSGSFGSSSGSYGSSSSSSGAVGSVVGSSSSDSLGMGNAGETSTYRISLG